MESFETFWKRNFMKNISINRVAQKEIELKADVVLS